MRAVGIVRRGRKKERQWRSFLRRTTWAASRHARRARGALDLAGAETSRAHTDAGRLALDDDTRRLQVRTPGAACAVVCVGHVVAVRDAFLADVAAAAIDRHGQTSTSSMRAISAPSPLRWPSFRMRV